MMSGAAMPYAAAPVAGEEANGINEFHRAIAEHFSKGGSILQMLGVLVGIVVVIAIVYWLTRRQEKARSEPWIRDHGRLFRDLLDKLGLSESQRNAVERLADDLEFEQPAALLLSEQRYRSAADLWLNRRQAAEPNRPRRPAEVLLEEIASVLFVTPRPASAKPVHSRDAATHKPASKRNRDRA